MLDMTRRKIAVAAGAGAAVIVAAGLGAAGAIGASHVLGPNEEARAVIDDAAAQLGVEPSELSDALRQALENRIDDAVESGKLTEDQAESLKDRLGSSDVPLLFGLGGPHGHGHGFGHRGGFGSSALLDAAASYLGLSEAELRDAVRDGTLADVAKEQGKSAAGLVDALVAIQTKRLAEAVDEGRLTDEQAADLERGLEERMQALVDGELRRPLDGSHRFWPGSGSPRAPPMLGGPSA
jgi:hypothetical protein